jgi:hypothetical protein
MQALNRETEAFAGEAFLARMQRERRYVAQPLSAGTLQSLNGRARSSSG